jgi:hypothetical protein
MTAAMVVLCDMLLVFIELLNLQGLVTNIHMLGGLSTS